MSGPREPNGRHPGIVPSVNKAGGIIVRHYRPDDDPYLMELERLSPRGEPRPFVHFRHRFIDRAMMQANPYLFIAEKDGRPVGVTSIAIKDTQIGGELVRLAYSFDTRVHPNYRRMGIANAMQEEKLAFLYDEGVHGIYADVVSTNQASIRMLEKVGFYKVRMVLYLTFTPYPLIIPPENEIYAYDEPQTDLIEETFGFRDLFVPDAAAALQQYNFQQFITGDNSSIASLSIYDQSLVSQQVSADEPWPTAEEVARRARTWRLFDEVGVHHKKLLKSLFDNIRDLAVVSNVSKLVWVIDRADPVPSFIFNEASDQKDYWIMFCPLVEDWEPMWNGHPIYIDAREL